MLEKDLLDRLQSLAKVASDKEIGEIPVNLLSKDDLRLIKKGAKEVEKCKKKGEIISCIFEVWYPLGKIAHKLQWYKQAEVLYRAVIEHDSRFPDGWFYLGLLMSARGLDIVAREMMNYALDCAPPDWDKLNRAKLIASKPTVKSQQAKTFQPIGAREQKPPKIKPNETKRPQLHLPLETKIRKTGKCAICEIKVGSSGFTCCFCGIEYCTDHRLPEKHSCMGSYRVTILREKGMPTDPSQLIKELHRIGKAAAKKAWINVSSSDVLESDFEILKCAYKKLLANAYENLPQANNFDLWFRTGKVAHCFQFIEIAEEFYKKALNFDTNQEVYENLGLVLKEQGKWGEAEIWFRKLIALDPEHTNAWMNLGKVLDAQNRADEAKLAFDTAIKQDHYKIRELIRDPRWSHAFSKERDENIFS